VNDVAGSAVRMPYPFAFDVERPLAFERAHIFLRIPPARRHRLDRSSVRLLWLGLHVVAAILVSQKGERRYLDDTGRG
jgi:hypothetical protein